MGRIKAHEYKRLTRYFNSLGLEANDNYKTGSLSLTWYRTLKDQMTCCECGTDHHITLHHVDPRTKKANPSQLARFCPDQSVLEKEILKCVPLCEPCHKDVHNGRLKGWLYPHDEKARAVMPELYVTLRVPELT